MVKEGTLTPVEYSEWAAPIVAVWKSNHQSVRICGDFRMTVNPVSKLNPYPLPRIEDLLATLAEGKIFTKLDLTWAYQQLKLSLSPLFHAGHLVVNWNRQELLRKIEKWVWFTYNYFLCVCHVSTCHCLFLVNATLQPVTYLCCTQHEL